MESQTSVIDQERRDRVRVVKRFYELLTRKDIDAWGELWHDEGRIVVPYPAEGFPSLIEGKATIVSGFHTCLRTSTRSSRS
jgi:ketosteroid isomerase-like protein